MEAAVTVSECDSRRFHSSCFFLAPSAPSAQVPVSDSECPSGSVILFLGHSLESICASMVAFYFFAFLFAELQWIVTQRELYNEKTLTLEDTD